MQTVRTVDATLGSHSGIDSAGVTLDALHSHTGLANLHNARRAGSPVVNLVGSMSTWHASADPLLSMDIEALASTVSCSVHTASTAADLTAAMAGACRAATARRPAGQSRVATLIVPHDLSRSTTTAGETSAASELTRVTAASNGGDQKAAMAQFTAACAAAIMAEPRGCVAFYLGGDALLRAGKSCHRRIIRKYLNAKLALSASCAAPQGTRC